MSDVDTTTREDSAICDLVRDAYAAEPGLVDFDVQAGLDRLMAARHTVGNMLVARSATGGYRCDAKDGRTVVFGRNAPDVHVELGAGDPMVSRTQGAVVHREDGWYLRNLGRSPIMVSDRMVVTGQEWGPLPFGSTSMFVVGTGARQHLLELNVGTRGDEPMAIAGDDVTRPPNRWGLTTRERLALSTLGRRYLAGEPHPGPLSLVAAAAELTALAPGDRWTPSRVSHLVMAVRNRMTTAGVPGLGREQAGGTYALHNLLVELLRTGSLTLTDLPRLEQRPA